MPELSRVKEGKVKVSWEFGYLGGFVLGIIDLQDYVTNQESSWNFLKVTHWRMSGCGGSGDHRSLWKIWSELPFFFFSPHPRTCLSLILEKKEKRGKEREEKTTGCLRHGPWGGMEPETLQCMGRHFNQLSHIYQSNLWSSPHKKFENALKIIHDLRIPFKNPCSKDWTNLNFKIFPFSMFTHSFCSDPLFIYKTINEQSGRWHSPKVNWID